MAGSSRGRYPPEYKERIVEPVDNVCENQRTMGITWMQQALGFSDADAQILWEACTDAC